MKRKPKPKPKRRPFVEHRNLGEIERRASLLSDAADGKISFDEAVQKMQERKPNE